MQVTRRFWAAVALIAFLVMTAIVFAQPLLVVGAAGLAAWLLIQQVIFVRTVLQIRDALTVTQSLPRDQLLVDDTTQVSVEATLGNDVEIDAPIQLDITGGLPVAATLEEHSAIQFQLPDDTTTTTTSTVSWPIAGHFEFDPPTVTVTNSPAFFQSTFLATGSVQPSITVVPHHPRNLHIGVGGDQVATAFGDHKTGAFGQGLDPGEVREYVPGDTVRQIDWKATARSTTPHVREFEEETDRQLVLIIDHRASMDTGTAGETKLDYSRQVALGLIEHAEVSHEPIGLYTVGNGGLTTRHQPATGATVYSTLRTALHDLVPTSATTSDPRHVQPSLASPTDARHRAAALRDDESAFATQVRPLFAAAETYVHRISTDPLYQTVQTAQATTDGTVSTFLVTDDQHRAEVRETAKLARNHHGTVHVFLTPTVLFEPDGLTDMAAAYDRYADFEEFRRDLGRLDDVSAYEVAPGDRLDALLATRASQSVTQRPTL